MSTIVHEKTAEKQSVNASFLPRDREEQPISPDVQPDERPRSDAGLRVSEEEYWEKYYTNPDGRYEWNNGILEEKPMADYLSFEMYSWFFSLLKEYLKACAVAKMVGLEIGFRLALPSKTAIRKPDLALVLQTNPIDIAGDDMTYHGIFDLCIEFLSDSTRQEKERDTIVKKAEYCQAGVPEYFLLDRNGRETAFYRLNRRGTYSPIRQRQGVIHSNVLPGFQFRLDDLYSQPPFRERIHDSVYQSFLLRDYQAEVRRADAAEQRAEVERQQAEQLAATLRALGVDPMTLG